MFKFKQHKDIEGPTPPPGNPLAGQKFVFRATEWKRQKKTYQGVILTRLFGIIEKP